MFDKSPLKYYHIFKLQSTLVHKGAKLKGVDGEKPILDYS